MRPCGTALPPAAKFCFECGRPVAALQRFAAPEAYTPRHLADKILTSRTALEGERKQVTVLFCDLVNATPLAERLGPEGMHALLTRFFELGAGMVHRLEGTVNQFLGDGFMALFGAPVVEAEARAHDAAERVADPRPASNAAWASGWIHATRGDWATGIEACRRALALAPDEVSRTFAGGFLGYAHLEQEDHAAALPLLARAAEDFAAFRFPQLAAYFSIFEGRARLLGGDPPGARAAVARGLRHAEGTTFGPAQAAAHRVLGDIAAAEGDLDAAEGEFRTAARILAAACSLFELARTRLALAAVLGARGRVDEAREESTARTSGSSPPGPRSGRPGASAWERLLDREVRPLSCGRSAAPLRGIRAPLARTIMK